MASGNLQPDLPSFRAPYAPADDVIAAALLASAGRSAATDARIDARAARLIEAIRAKSGGLGGVEDFLHAYALSTKEGLALMVLAEALLRIPDAGTADRLIEDKLKGGDWAMTLLNRSKSPRALTFAWASEAVTDTVSKLSPRFATTRYLLRDLWTKKDAGTTASPLSAKLPGHDVLMLRLRRS